MELGWNWGVSKFTRNHIPSREIPVQIARNHLQSRIIRRPLNPMKVQVLSPAPFELGRAPESGALFVVGKCGFVDAQQCAKPCVVCASVVQSEANGAPPTRAALVPYLSRFTLAGVTGFFTHKAVRHPLLTKLTIPITTVRSAHTAMIVWGSMGFSDLSKPPGRRSTELAHYSMLHSSYPLLGRAHDRQHAQASECRRTPVNDQGPSDCALELVTPAR